MAISLSGVGSGLDIQTLVSQLVAAEGQAKTASLDRREKTYQTQISALGQLKSGLSALKDSTAQIANSANLLKKTTSLSSEGYFTATPSSTAVDGVYDIEVIQLATASKVASAGYANSGATVGSGRLTITSGNNTFIVDIPDAATDPTKQSLEAIRDAINSESTNSSVTAAIVNVDATGGGTETRLVLTAKNTGLVNTISVAVMDDDGDSTDTTGLSALSYDVNGGTSHMQELVEALDSKIKVDTLTITRSSNSIEDAIPGLTLDLRKAEPNFNISLDVKTDNESSKESIETMIKSYNSLISTYNSLANYNSETETAGALVGDFLSRQIAAEIKGILRSDTGSSEFPTLFSAGIEIDKDGKLQINSTRFDAMLNSSPDALSEIFGGSNGIAAKIESRIASILELGSSFDTRTKGLQDSLKSIEEERDKLEIRLDAIEESLMKQFIAMDVLVAQYGATGTYLTNQLAALPGFTATK